MDGLLYRSPESVLETFIGAEKVMRENLAILVGLLGALMAVCALLAGLAIMLVSIDNPVVYYLKYVPFVFVAGLALVLFAFWLGDR